MLARSQRHSGRRAKSLRNSPEIGEKSIKKGPPGRAYGEGRARAILRASDILLTRGVYRTGPGWACRAKPKWGAASEMSPNPAPLLPRVAPPDALRLLWRILLRSGGPRALLNQCCGGVAVPRGGGKPSLRGGGRTVEAGSPNAAPTF
jgi:hypothetical protein